MSEIPFREPGRRTPAKGVHVSLGGPNWIFLTVCTEKRERWLAQSSVQRALHKIWEHTATAWLVSDYLLMPDHLHLLLQGNSPSSDLLSFVKTFKHKTTFHFRSKTGKTLWQISFFDHILRTAEDLSKTAEYILLNPVRAGLVKRPEDYPYSRIFSRSH